MLRYWAMDLCRSWSKRIAALFIVLSMLLSDLVTFAEPNGSSTDTQTLICGRAEHRHTDACYEDVLVCGIEETEPVRTYKTTFSPHTHSEACYDKEGNLACGIMENEYYHKHNDFCKDADGNPICGLKFKKPHEHTEECFDADGNQICTTPILTHKHSAACYDDKGSLICGQWEIPSFTSTADNLIETPGHHHDAGCYERRLTCGQEEHVHSPACYATEEKTEPAENTDTVDEVAAEQPDEQTNTGEATEQTEEAEKDTAEQQAQTDNQPENTDTNTTVDASGNDTPETIDATIDAGTESSAESTNVSTEETNNTGSIPENTEPEEKPVEEKTSEENSNEENASEENASEENVNEENVNEENAIEEKPIYETNGDVLIRYNGDETAVTVPDGIRKIDKKVFYNNKTITTVILPDSVEVINSSAFAECTNLEKVILSNQSGLELIGPAAFKNDRKLDTSFAANVDRIVENAFAGIAQEETTEEEQTGEEEQTNTEEQNNAEEETRTEEQNKEEEQTNIEEQTREEDQTEEEEQTGEDDQTGEDNEHAEPEKSEKTEESEDTENLEKTEESHNKENQEEPENPDELTIPAPMTIPSDKDAPYQVNVTIPADAGIPEGTELVVAEQAEPQMRLMKSTPKNTTPMKLLGGKSLTVQEQPADEETYASIPSLTEWQEGAEAPEIVLYKKTLDISLVTADGEEIEPDPEAKITVSVNLPEIEDGQEVEVRHITDNGSELLESTNDAGTITFTTNSFSLFEFTSTAQKLSSWTSGLLENTFFGKTDAQETTHEEISVDNVTEGLSILEAFSVTKNSDLWMTLRQIQRLVLGKLESLTLYTVENGKLGSIVRDNITLSDILRFNLGDLSSFALVKDSGLRRKTQDLGNIILNGMMPKGATAEAEDVTEAYADIDFSTRLESDEKKEKNTPDSTDSKDSSRIENSQERGDLKTRNENKTDFSLLAAYDISILNGNEEYQPEEGNAITVEIQNDSIHSGMNLQLWHIKDDGTREQVKDFSLKDGKISFEATGFSVYALVYRIETYYVDAKGDTYHITVEYGDDADLPEDVELSVSEVDAGSYLNEAAEALKTQADYLLYRKFLDISFVQKITDEETGEEQIRIIEPQAPVSVSVRLMDVTDGAEALQVVHFGRDGAEKLTAETNKEAVVTFTTPSFSVFGIGNVLQPLAATETENANIEILGFNGEASLTETQAPTMEEGLEVLRAFTLRGETVEAAEPAETSETTETTEITEGPDAPQETGEEPAENEEANTGSITNSLWIKAKLKDDTELSEMESVVLYTVNGEDTAPLIESLTTGSQVAKLEAAEVAIVKDTGYRHLNLVLNMDEDGQAESKQETANQTDVEEENTTQTETTETEDAGSATENEETASHVVILDGMMPKEAGATAVDVTEAYADHEYVVPEEEQDEAEETEEKEEVSEESQENAQEDELSTSGHEQAESGEDNTETGETTEGEAEQPEDNDLGSDNVEGTGEAEPAEEKPVRTTLAAYNITISNNESEYQPDADHPITVEIRDDRITADGNIELWHIKDDGTEERVEEYDLFEGKIVFTANGFSAYSIVNFEYVTGWYQATTFDKIDELALASTGFYLDYEISGKHNYVSKGTVTANTRPGINGITTTEQNPSVAGAVKYYFEKVPNTDDHQYYIYMYDDDNDPSSKKYVKMYMVQDNNARGGFEFVTDIGTAFTLVPDNGKFYITTTFTGQTKPHRWNRNNKNGGIGAFVGWQNDNGNPNAEDARFALRYYIEPEGDPYDLDEKIYGLMRWNDGATGRAIMADSLSETSLASQTMMILTNRTNHNDMLFVPKDSDITLWTFDRIAEDKYYIKTTVNGNVEYLKITSGGLTLTQTPDESCKIQVVPGTQTHQGEICLKVGNKTLVFSGNDATGFGISGSAGDEWLHLVDVADITSDYVVTYTADEVDISNRDQVPDGSRVIIYTRIWDDIHKEYDFYALDHDGSLVPVYENGDTIQWVGDRLNTMVWDFVEYCYEGTTEPNGFYELKNEYSNCFLGPQYNGQLISGNPVGINLPGRANGIYYSEIFAWDDPYYAYAGIKTNGTNGVVTCLPSEAGQFYFAIMVDRTSDQLSTVSTVDHAAYGVTMKIKDFNTRKEMSDFLGNDDGGVGTKLQQGLLSTNLIDGYPTAAGGSLSGLFNNLTEVNHLFLSGTYYGTGYFEYDSTENFASIHGTDFVVYKEIGTYDSGGNKNTLKHGQFMPFNDIAPGEFATTNGENLYDALANELPEGHPRKYEKLYKVTGNANMYFGVELSASFVQTPSGHDAWGHDIIYEFTGDDDFWLYVDNELIIDLGGIHSAVSGKVNYATGRVEVNGVSTNLRDIFYKNYINRGDTPDVANAKCDEIFIKNENDQWVFKEYTAHDMKLFYMERGAGASNLHMRFNLASVKPGQVQLTKKVSGSDDIDYNLAKFPFQIYYKIDGDNEFKLLEKRSATTEGGTEIINVHYANASSTPVAFYEDYEIRIGETERALYHNVFVLRANETIEISVPDNTVEYYLVECGVNKQVYKNVIVNNGDIEVEKRDTDITDRKDYAISSASVDERRNVVFENIVDPEGLRSLTIEKKLIDESGQDLTEADDPTVFKYRIYVSSESNSNPTLAYMLPYRVKNPDGVYCKRRIPGTNGPDDKGGFDPIGSKTDFSTLTDEEKQKATFETSTNGAISMIPAGYQVEIPNLPIGTYFKIEERNTDIPDGYKFVQFDYEQEKFYLDEVGVNSISGGIRPNNSPSFIVTNQRGWKLDVEKIWTDENLASVKATGRNPIYVAIYVDDVLLYGSLREITYPDTSTSYYFDTLTADFDKYVVREVTVEGDIITPIEENGVVAYGWPGKTASESPRSYVVNYEQGTEEDGTLSGTILNVREDTITNTRGGGIIYKLIDYATNKPLKGGVFKLQKYNSTTQSYDDVDADNKLYTTGKNGRITILYDFEINTDYVLTQVSAPAGYVGITEPVKVWITHDTTDEVHEEDHNENGWVTWEHVSQTTGNDLIADITIRNKPFTLKAIKIKAPDPTDPTDEPIPLPGATFALYRQLKIPGELIKDKNPMANYNSLVSDAYGVIPKIDQTITPGTYYLTELSPPVYYIGIEEDVIISISELGAVTMDCENGDVTIDHDDTTTPGREVYTITIPNEKTDMAPPFLSVEKKVEGKQGDFGKDFDFTISGLTATQEYAFIRYTTQDGVQWTPVDGGVVRKANADSNGTIQFQLKHYERITFSLAGEDSINYNIKIKESDSDNRYNTSYTIDAGEAQSSRETGNIGITNNTDTVEVRYTNILNSISPTDVRIHKVPYLLMLLIGVFVMIMTGIGVVRNKRKQFASTQEDTGTFLSQHDQSEMFTEPMDWEQRLRGEKNDGIQSGRKHSRSQRKSICSRNESVGNIPEQIIPGSRGNLRRGL